MSRKHLTTALLLLVLVALFALPLVLNAGEFGGTDDAATALIESSRPDYQPWYHSLFEPSGEVESGLFALQAAIGAGIVGYAIGIYRGRRQTVQQGAQQAVRAHQDAAAPRGEA